MAENEPSPGYTEADIEEMINNRRFLAAVHSYALGRLTIGQAISSSAGYRVPAAPEKFRHNLTAYWRFIHEIAKRIVSGRIAIPPGLEREYADIYAARVPELWRNRLGSYTFSELESMPVEVSPLPVRRQSFEEEDIRALLSDPLILACIDAYGQGMGSFNEAVRRMFGDANFHPRNLSGQAFLGLAFEVIQRIKDGRIALAPSLRDQHPSAYVSQIQREEV
jgi:hypothetical protein